MTTLVNKLVVNYKYIFYDLADPRAQNYFLIPSPWPIVTLTFLYLYISTSFGPKYMKDRPPYNLKNVVLAYNVFQVFMSTYLCSEGLKYILSEQFNFYCEPVDYSDSPKGLWLTGVVWWYFFSKVIEYLDTIFFVLRKKNDQISFLHVYHHSLMAFTMWIGVKYFPGGHGVVMGTLNSFVHIIMYTYYFIAGLGPKYQKYIWWKKHVTVLQLVQFVIILIHNMIPIFNDCSFPKILNILMSLNALVFIYLFGKFFYASYMKERSEHSKNGTVKNGTTKNGSKNCTVNGTTNGHSYIGKNIDQNKNGGETIISNGKHKND